MIFHVPRLLLKQCFTTLFILVKQSWLIIGSKKTAPKAPFFLVQALHALVLEYALNSDLHIIPDNKGLQFSFYTIALIF